MAVDGEFVLPPSTDSSHIWYDIFRDENVEWMAWDYGKRRREAIQGNEMRKYKCNKCHNIISRKSEKKWIKSYCDKLDCVSRLILIKE